jgi:hypothetical protein
MGIKAKMMKKIFILLALAILIAGCSVNTVPTEKKIEFAETIGSYTLENNQNRPTECDIFEKDTKDVEGNELGLEGQVCTRTTILRYVDPSTRRVVFVHLNKFMEGKDVMKKLLGEVYPRIMPGVIKNIENTNVYRMEKAELFWFSDSDVFGQVLIQEGEMTKNPDGSTSYDYPYQASMDNSVTQHFLEKYPASVW